MRVDRKELRLKLPRKLLIDYQKLCVELELSVPKQTTQLIENFMQMQKDNLSIQRELKRMVK